MEPCHRLIKSTFGLNDIVVVTRVIRIQRNAKTQFWMFYCGQFPRVLGPCQGASVGQHV